MSRIQELDKLDRALKDAEIRLKSIKTAIENIDKEIGVLTPKKTELEKNIEFLKKQDTIPLAHEYRKSKAELSKIKTRLSMITLDKTKSAQACVDVERIIEKFKKDYQKLVLTNENNILKGNFGGKNGKR